MKEDQVLQGIRNNEPFKGLANVRVANLRVGPAIGDPFDIKADLVLGDPSAIPRADAIGGFETLRGQNKVAISLEVKTICTPRQIEQLAPWISRMKRAMSDRSVIVLACPALSTRSQALCIEKGLDFLDLAGNFSINVPGQLFIQRTGQKVPEKIKASFYRNPFSGNSSRILRVLLQGPRNWTLTEIMKELRSETLRAQACDLNFEISTGFASRVLRSLEEDLLITRRSTLGFSRAAARRGGGVAPENEFAFSVPEPERLLARWAEEYRKRFRRDLRKSFLLPNPFGNTLAAVKRGFDSIVQGERPNCYAFTAAAAAGITAPYVDFDPIDIFVSEQAAFEKIRSSVSGPIAGPDLRIIYPYDPGVFMYLRDRSGVPAVSEIQVYLDLVARGGRDMKQAEVLLEKRIMPVWRGE